MKNRTIHIYNILILILLSGCAAPVPQDSAPKQYVDVSTIPNAVPKAEPRSRYGNPASYEVNGRVYHVLNSARGYDKKGIASWYGTKFHGKLTSTREIYDMFGMTAASTVLPLPTYVEVTNLENGREVTVKVNDRGPFDKDRIIDLSYAAARKLGFANRGTALVEVKAINPQDIKRPHIYLQIGAFSNQDNAIALRNKIAALTQEKITINRSLTNHRTLYRVEIGPLASVHENDQLQQILAQQGLGRAVTMLK